MLGEERRSMLLGRLRRDGKVLAKELSVELGLSEDTLRRDLRELAAAGLCQRVYGGALPISPALAGYVARTEVEPDSKKRVAARAVQLITSGSTVILDGGTTTLAVVAALPLTASCLIITHSPTIATALLDHSDVEVLLIGGRLFKHSAVCCGSVAVEAALKISADIFLLGVTGVHPTAGLTTGDAEEAAMKRTLAGRAADTYVLASSEKIGAASQFEVLPINAVAGIVTDTPPGHPTIETLAAAGVAVVAAH